MAATLRPSDGVLPALPYDLGFMQVLWSVDHALNVTSRRMVTRLGLTGPQRLVIRLLGRFPGSAPGVLAQVLHLHPGTLSGILRRLEERGLVVRVPDPKDGRRSPFRLTPKGKALDAPDSHTVEAAVSRVLSRLPRKQVEITRRVLAALEQELSA